MPELASLSLRCAALRSLQLQLQPSPQPAEGGGGAAPAEGGYPSTADGATHGAEPAAQPPAEAAPPPQATPPVPPASAAPAASPFRLAPLCAALPEGMAELRLSGLGLAPLAEDDEAPLTRC